MYIHIGIFACWENSQSLKNHCWTVATHSTDAFKHFNIIYCKKDFGFASVRSLMYNNLKILLEGKMKPEDSKEIYTGSKVLGKYLIHSLNGNTNGNNTAESIMNVINQKPSSSTRQTSRHTGEGE